MPDKPQSSGRNLNLKRLSDLEGLALAKVKDMDWRTYIDSDPEILLGKPAVKGTRLAIDFILGLFAAGWTPEQVLENYPTLTPESLQAVFAFAAECLHEEALYAVPSIAS